MNSRCLPFRLLALFALLGLALIFSTSPVTAVSDKGDFLGFEKYYQKADAGFKARDVKAIVAPLADDFQMTDKRGKIENRASYEAGLKEMFAAGVRIEECVSKILDISVKDGVTSLTTTSRMVAIFKDAEGHEHRGVADSKSVDQWIKVDGVDKLWRVKTVSSKETIDGKVTEE